MSGANRRLPIRWSRKKMAPNGGVGRAASAREPTAPRHVTAAGSCATGRREADSEAVRSRCRRTRRRRKQASHQAEEVSLCCISCVVGACFLVAVSEVFLRVPASSLGTRRKSPFKSSRREVLHAAPDTRYTHIPGTFTVTLRTARVPCEHLPNTLRISIRWKRIRRPATRTRSGSSVARSRTGGRSTMRRPTVAAPRGASRIRNRQLRGQRYGTLHSLIQFREHCRKGNQKSRSLLRELHDTRNTFSADDRRPSHPGTNWGH